MLLVSPLPSNVSADRPICSIRPTTAVVIKISKITTGRRPKNRGRLSTTPDEQSREDERVLGIFVLPLYRILTAIEIRASVSRTTAQFSIGLSASPSTPTCGYLLSRSCRIAKSGGLTGEYKLDYTTDHLQVKYLCGEEWSEGGLPDLHAAHSCAILPDRVGSSLFSPLPSPALRKEVMARLTIGHCFYVLPRSRNWACLEGAPQIPWSSKGGKR